jgi:hypothetical protein
MISSTGLSRNKWACLNRVADSAWNGQSVATRDVLPLALNNEYLTVVNAAGTGVVNVIKADASNCIRLSATSPAFTRIDGMVKMFNRPTTDVFAVQIKSEFTGTNKGHNCVEVTADWKGDGVTGGGNTAIQGTARVAATFTMAAGALIGTYGQACVNGTVTGGVVAGLYGIIEDGGTYTAVSHVASAWLDSHLAQVVTSGHSEMLYISHNGTTDLESVFYVYPGNHIANLLTIDSTDTGLVSAKTSGAVASIAGWRTIKCSIHGETTYLLVATTIS